MTLANSIRERYFKDMDIDSYLAPSSNNIFKITLPLFRLEQSKKESPKDYPAIKISADGSDFTFYSVGSFNFEISIIKEIHDNEIIGLLTRYLNDYELKAALVPEKNSELVFIESKRPMPVKHWLNHILVFTQGLVSINDIFALGLEK